MVGCDTSLTQLIPGSLGRLTDGCIASLRLGCNPSLVMCELKLPLSARPLGVPSLAQARRWRKERPASRLVDRERRGWAGGEGQGLSEGFAKGQHANPGLGFFRLFQGSKNSVTGNLADPETFKIPHTPPSSPFCPPLAMILSLSLLGPSAQTLARPS